MIEESEEQSSEPSTENAADVPIQEEILDIVSTRTAMCSNAVLAFQIQQAMPFDVTLPERRRSSLISVLRAVSEKSLQNISQEERNKEVVFQIPRMSVQADAPPSDEYVIAGNEDVLLTKDFVRSLPVTIQEKRHYRQSVIYSLKKKSYYKQYRELIVEKITSFSKDIDLWHNELKSIEGQHGAAIVSYFVFIRWLLFLNLIIFAVNFSFLVFPHLVNTHDKKFDITSSSLDVLEHLSSNPKERDGMEILQPKIASLLDTDNSLGNFSSVDDLNKHCQTLYSQQISNNTRSGFFSAIQNILQGTGPLETSLLFLGFYPPYINSQYNVALASLCLLFLTFFISIYLMIHYSTIGIQEAFLARSNRSNYYSNETFSAWNYCLDKPKSAEQEHFSFVLAMKTTLSEERMKEELIRRSTKTWIKIYTIRIAVNIVIITWLFSAYYFIYNATVFQLKELNSHRLSDSGFRTFMVQFVSPFTVMIVNSVSPALFTFLIQFEDYHAQTVLNVTLIRNVFVYLSSVMLLLNTFYHQTACEPKDHCGAGLSSKCRSPRCWETYLGQQLYKLTITDLFVYIGKFVCVDTVRYYVTKTFDNKLTRLWGPPVFPLSSEVLAPVNSQTILWLGLFYSPLLPGVMVLKLIAIFYIKKTKILKYCERSFHSYRASRFNAVFMMILLVSFFTVLIGQSFAIERISPSRGCGPYRQLDYMTKAIPTKLRGFLSLFMSHWTILITTILLCIVMDYYYNVIASKKELCKHLKEQLVLESCDKQYLLKQIAELSKAK